MSNYHLHEENIPTPINLVYCVTEPHASGNPSTVARFRDLADAHRFVASMEVLEAVSDMLEMCVKSGIPGTTSAWYVFGEQTARVLRIAIAHSEGRVEA